MRNTERFQHPSHKVPQAAHDIHWAMASSSQQNGQQKLQDPETVMFSSYQEVFGPSTAAAITFHTPKINFTALKLKHMQNSIKTKCNLPFLPSLCEYKLTKLAVSCFYSCPS